MLKFFEDAIELSGETGTKLKSEILGAYYPLWWYITSGGPNNLHNNPTAFIEMNAGSGENYITDTKTTILGSSGHAIEVKARSPSSPLKIILVERDHDCYYHLKQVISKRWPNLQWTEDNDEDSDIYLLNTNTDNAIRYIGRIELGRSLFFFDPLLYTPWHEIDKVARQRITKYYQTGTEFVVFLFTSDWFYGRNEMSSLPTENNPEKWDEGQKKTIEQVDDLFGHTLWRKYLLNSKPIEEKMEIMIKLYRRNLHTWFRYVLAFPFKPKQNQEYHLFMCSNYEEGINITRKFYANHTGNPKYSPDYDKAFLNFRVAHKIPYFKKNTKPPIWRILWRIVKDHEEGICDVNCFDLKRIVPDYVTRKTALEWLEEQGYLEKINHLTTAWIRKPDIFQMKWDKVKNNLKIDLPPKLKSLEHVLQNIQPEKKSLTLDDFLK